MKREMLKEFLHIIAERNSYQEKYLQTAMEGITYKEIQKLESMLIFFTTKGYSVEQIAEMYLNLIDMIMEEQKFFMLKGMYRFSKYEEVAELCRTSSYMDYYVVGLGLSLYLWHIHRGLMRFFIEHCQGLQGKNYLEIGPGHGEYFVIGMENSNFVNYVAVDISETSVNMTRDFCQYSMGVNTSKNYEILHKDFFDFTSKDKFDAIIMGEVLEHVEEPEEFLNKIYEISNDDAFIYVSTAINAPQPDHIYHFKTLEEVSDLFAKCKLGIIEQITLTANNVTLEKAIKKKYAIVVGYILKKM